MEGEVGRISLERGDLAIREQEPGYERLFLCRSIYCEMCGMETHGIPGTVYDEVTPQPERSCRPGCPIPLTDEERQSPPFHCYECGSHVYHERIERHYHLAAMSTSPLVEGLVRVWNPSRRGRS